jgi:hypothetical protein
MLGTTYTWEEHCQTLPPYNHCIKVYSASTIHCYSPWGWILCIRNMSEEGQRSVLCFNRHFNCIFKWKHYGVLVKTLWCFTEWCVKTRTVYIDFIKNKCASRSVSAIKNDARCKHGQIHKVWFIEVNKHFWSLEAIYYFAACDHYWMKSYISVRGQ